MKDQMKVMQKSNDSEVIEQSNNISLFILEHEVAKEIFSCFTVTSLDFLLSLVSRQ